MKAANAIRFAGRVAAALSGVFLHSAQAADIPKIELANILNNIGISAPWRIDQIAYESQGPKWQIDVYHDARQLTPKICVASVEMLVVSKKDENYAIDGEQSSKAVALSRCERARAGNGKFADLTGDVTDAQLVAA